MIMQWWTERAPTLGELVQDFRAWRGGMRRVAPYGCRGRIYGPIHPAPIDTANPGAAAAGPVRVRVEPTATIVPSRIYCAKEGKWYSLAEWLEKQDNEED